MKNSKVLLAIALLLISSNAFPHEDHYERNEDIHNLIGGYSAGILGSKLGGGTGRDIAIAAGAALGFRYTHDLVGKILKPRKSDTDIKRGE